MPVPCQFTSWSDFCSHLHSCVLSAYQYLNNVLFMDRLSFSTFRLLGTQGTVPLTFRKLSNIISRKYIMPEITFMGRSSSWNFVGVSKASCWAQTVPNTLILFSRYRLRSHWGISMWPEMIDRKQAFQNVGWFYIDGGEPDVILTIKGFRHTGL